VTDPLCPLAAIPLGRLLRIERLVFHLEKWICIVALAVMLLAVTASVLVRNFNLPMLNPGEWGLVAMAPLTFVGAALCSYTGTHIAVDIIHLVKSAAIRRVARLLVAFAMLVFAAAYFWTGGIYFQEALVTGERLLDTGTPVAIPLFFLPLGMALVLIHTLAELARAITGGDAHIGNTEESEERA